MNLNENLTIIEKFLQPLFSTEIKSLKGLNGAAAAIVFAALANRSELNVLITVSENRAREIAENVRTWLSPQQNQLYCWLPERDSVYDHTATDPNIINDHLAAMSAQMRSGGLIIVPVRELLMRHYSPQKWLKKCFTLKTGDLIGREEVIAKLVAAGYKRTNLVEEPGYFAVRGALIDFFPPDYDNPVRLDFFGGELDTIKEFVVSNQRSINKKDHIFVIPATKYIAEDQEHDRLVENLAQFEKHLPKRQAALLERKLEHFIAHADSRDYFELKPIFEPGTFSLLDYWPDARLIVEDVEASLAALVEERAKLEHKYRQVIDLTPLPAPEKYYFAGEQVKAILKKKKIIEFSRFGQADNLLCEKMELHPPPADSSRETLLNELKSLLSKGWAVVLVINDESRFHNLRGLLGERGITLNTPQQPFSLKPAAVTLLRGNLRKGFKDYRTHLAIYAEEDIFLGPARESSRRRHPTQQNILALSQIVPGDIVVHADHGLAEFRGVHTMTAAGNTREYLLLQYAGNDRLYVPTDQVHKVSKYIGIEGFVPKIHSLNSKVWLNQKGRVSKNIENIARELLELYAKRQGSTGFAFAKDCDLQREMESRFPFSETPDQLKAIEATKKDMESQVPMDRLICGDVGYGKTEIAMRAAFKAVCSGKQVAVLAPTTLLALQHFQTFKQRFEGLPITVDMVSRLRKPSEQKEIIKKLKAGTLDVLIGTHRLLSTDFVFSRLGLLIIDEEQRFGVKQKERLKQLKTNIDVLTLTATPIPRTLQMALSGIRQISIIDTPPAERHPVQTYVAPFDPAWIKRAIVQELKRGGQIFYVFNRVEKIDQKAHFLRELLPEARVAIAHGQMPERQVETTILAFINQEYDILLSTTIIESGLDIANVNTLIVDEAERLGLSQLYQLRGRVGRSSRQAWAYFFYSKNKKLTKEAAERLETIEEHTALGSGFKIALRDLQIRGAGNLLGESQSGHISSVGFSLYMELLEETISRLKLGKAYRQKIEAAIEIPVTAYFPIHYIPDEETRIELYARLSRCDDINLLQLIKEECLDRFGQIPPEAEALFSITRLRILASEAGIKKIARIINHLRFEFASGYLPDIEKLFKYDDPLIRNIYLNPTDQNSINFNIKGNDIEKIFYDAEQLLQILVCVKVETKVNQN